MSDTQSAQLEPRRRSVPGNAKSADIDPENNVKLVASTSSQAAPVSPFRSTKSTWYIRLIRREGPVLGLLATGTGTVVLNQYIANQVQDNLESFCNPEQLRLRPGACLAGHCRRIGASLGMGEICCHILCCIPSCKGSSCQCQTYCRAVLSFGNHWFARCGCLCGQCCRHHLLRGNSCCPDPCWRAAAFHCCHELYPVGAQTQPSATSRSETQQLDPGLLEVHDSQLPS